jgi:hypothetical protein
MFSICLLRFAIQSWMYYTMVFKQLHIHFIIVHLAVFPFYVWNVWIFRSMNRSWIQGNFSCSTIWYKANSFQVVVVVNLQPQQVIHQASDWGIQASTYLLYHSCCRTPYLGLQAHVLDPRLVFFCYPHLTSLEHGCMKPWPTYMSTDSL